MCVPISPLFIIPLPETSMAARIQAWDIHLESSEGHVHFQILTKPDASDEDVHDFFQKHVESEKIDVKKDTTKIEKLGHDQGDADGQADQIKDVGYAILKVHPA